MILWTIQNKIAYEKMKISGSIRADSNHILEESFREPYLWMASQMRKRIGEAPKGVVFPIWAWYMWEGKRKRPDMRFHGRNWSVKGSHIVLLTINVPEKFVLLSDFDYWHCVLNNSDIIFPYNESVTYTEKEKKKSWENIFNIDCSFDGEEHPFLTTQATLWEIKSEWIKKSKILYPYKNILLYSL